MTAKRTKPDKPARTFEWWGKRLTIVDHPYNSTAWNERGVELAIAATCIPPPGSKASMLELGNVLGHYGTRGHRVVDRYEEGPDVENLDVFAITGNYDLVVSISTVEHVEHDHAPRSTDGAARAIAHLRSLVAPGGRMLVTAPLGYHPGLDRLILSGESTADRECTLVRDGDRWIQTDELTFRPYGQTNPWAGAVWIGEWRA